jgi:hypothetical protein
MLELSCTSPLGARLEVLWDIHINSDTAVRTALSHLAYPTYADPKADTPIGLPQLGHGIQKDSRTRQIVSIL